MTNQIFEVLLEKPHKLERLVLLLLKTLITVWLLNLIIAFIEPNCFESSSSSADVMSLEFIKNLSAFRASVYLVSFIGLWIVLWEIFSNWILPPLCKLYVWILQIFLLIIPSIIAAFMMVSYQKLFKKNKKQKEHTDSEKISGTQALFRRLNDENRTRFFFGSLFIFHFMNAKTKSSVGSEALHAIMEYENKEFVKSRILAYYTIIITLYIAIGILKPEWTTWVYYLVLIILSALAIFIAAMKDVLNDLDSNSLVDLKIILPIDMYIDMVDKTFEKHKISKNFHIESLRKRLVLSRVATKNEVTCDFPRKKINVLRFKSTQETMEFDLSFKKLKEQISENTKLIIVADMIPDLALRNFMKEKSIYFIYAENDEQLFLGLNQVWQLLVKWVEVNYQDQIEQ